jgi:hypothetical protein
MSGGRHYPDRAYLLRCWREGSSAFDGENRYRFFVEEVLGERWRRGFTSVEALIAFLQAELARCGDEPPDASQDAARGEPS